MTFAEWWAMVVENPSAMRDLMHAHFQALGFDTNQHGAIHSPYDYVHKSLLRRTERVRTPGTVMDLDCFAEYRRRACAIEFKSIGQPLNVGQLRCLRYLAERDIPSFVAWLDDTGEVVRAAEVPAFGEIVEERANSAGFFEHVNSIIGG